MKIETIRRKIPIDFKQYSIHKIQTSLISINDTEPLGFTISNSNLNLRATFTIETCFIEIVSAIISSETALQIGLILRSLDTNIKDKKYKLKLSGSDSYRQLLDTIQCLGNFKGKIEGVPNKYDNRNKYILNIER